MWGISLKTKARGILLTVSVLMLTAMLALSFLSEKAGCKNLLLVTLHGWSLRSQDFERIEELCEDEFLLTYEIPQNASAKAVNLAHTVTLTGTNSAYPDVMGYRMRNGGFFTESAWESNEKHAVLNEAAAFTVFGSGNISGATVRINGETWLVTGVIMDNDAEKANIYVPSGVTGGNIQSLMALMGNSGDGEAYVINGLKNLGIRDTNSDFINLSKAASAFTERFWVSLKAACCFTAILLGKKGALWIAKRLSDCKNRLRRVYLRELIAESRTEFAKICAVSVLLLADIAAALYFMLQILENCLAWQELSLPARYLSGDFANKLAWVYDYQTLGIGSFSIFILAAAGIFVLVWKSAPSKKYR